MGGEGGEREREWASNPGMEGSFLGRVGREEALTVRGGEGGTEDEDDDEEEASSGAPTAPRFTLPSADKRKEAGEDVLSRGERGGRGT